MRLVYFLTFVWFTPLIFAAPDSTITPQKIDTGPKSSWQKEGETLIASRANTPHIMTVSVGNWFGPLVDKGEFRSTPYLGISQTNQNSDWTSQHYGVELTQIGLVGAHLQMRRMMSYGGSFDPFYQAGVGALYKPQEGLATFINYERYQLRAGAGFENMFNLKGRVRLEGNIGVSTFGLNFSLQVGYAFAD